MGLLVTTWIPKILFAAATRPDLRSYDFDFDVPLSAAVLTYSLILSLVTGAVFGLAPALKFTRPDLSSALKDAGALGTKLSRSRLRNMLMAGQVAFSLMLLIVSGLFVRSVLRVNFLPRQPADQRDRHSRRSGCAERGSCWAGTQAGSWVGGCRTCRWTCGIAGCEPRAGTNAVWIEHV